MAAGIQDGYEGDTIRLNAWLPHLEEQSQCHLWVTMRCETCDHRCPVLHILVGDA
uniref:Uncharacterized protein n=1 Tax=Arundo donax TaxID=35708 RepID=A0A0A9H5C9_ARUDO